MEALKSKELVLKKFKKIQPRPVALLEGELVRIAPAAPGLDFPIAFQPSAGEVDLADDTYITVLNEDRMWAKIPYIDDDGNVYKDADLEVGTDTTTIPPKANITPSWYGATIDSVSELITVDFDRIALTRGDTGEQIAEWTGTGGI